VEAIVAPFDVSLKFCVATEFMKKVKQQYGVYIKYILSVLFDGDN
jgi:hypothetical protein